MLLGIIYKKMNKKYSEQYPVCYVDNDKSLKLENNSLFRNIFNIFFIPILNSLPKDFKKIIKKTNNAASVVIENATTHKALEVLYSKGDLFSFKGLGNRFFKYVWFNLENTKGVRNRLKFVKREISNHLKQISKIDKEINIISIASGSSRAVVEVVQNEEYLRDTKLSLTFLDKSEHAIDYSKNLSTKISHLPIKLEWIHGTVGSFLSNPPEKKFDIVEIVGLLDYFDDKKTEEVFRGIYNILQDGGILITANICHNKEEKFVTKIIDWPMIYRSPDELANLVYAGGFDYNKMKVFYEPLKIHGIVVAKK